MLSGIWERIRSTVGTGIGWVGDTWAVKAVASKARSVIEPVVDIIGEPLATLLTEIADSIDAVIQLVLTPIRKAWAPLGVSLAGFVDQARWLASSVYDGFRKVVLVHLPRLRRWVIDNVLKPLWDGVNGITRWARERVSDLRQTLKDLNGWATARISDLRRSLTSLRQWVIDNVLRPLWDAVTDLGDFVYGRVLTVVNTIELIYTTTQAIIRYGPGQLLNLLLPGGMGRLAADLVRSTQGSIVETVEALDDAADRMLRL